MVADAYKTIYGSVAGVLIYATKFLLGSLNFSKNQIPQDPVSVEGKFNNHIEKAFKKIEEWKEKHDIKCEIFLAFGTNSNETIEFGQETIIGGEDKGIFLKNLKTENISIFEKLADDLTKEKILLTNEHGENLKYNYSQKLKDSCKGKKKVVLTYQFLSWNYNKTPQNHSFWLPKEQAGKSNRILVFDYQEREYEEDLKKIKQWQSDNGNCEITLLVDGTESIRINDIETNPYNFFGSSIFAKNITPSGGGSKISRFEKLAKDLERKKIQLTNEYGESLPYDYSKKLKDACSNNKITLTFQSLNWIPKGKPEEQHSFWLPKETNSTNRSLIFNYQERDYTTPLNKIKKWKKENDSESCEIILFVTDTESIKISEIESNPHKFLGSELFFKNITTKDGKSISKFEKLANDLAQGRFEVIDTAGENLDYSYSKKIKNSCDNNSNSITLKLTTVTWDPNNKPKQEHTFWLPKNENDNTTLVFNFLERDYETPLKKIQQWKNNNDNCEIKLLFDSTSLKISDFEKNPNNHLGTSLFTRDLDDVGMGTKISRFEKLANDLEKEKIKLINQYGENLDYSYSKKIKDACKNNQVTLTFKEVKWIDGVSKKEQKHSFWIPESEKESDNNTIIFNYQERNYKDSLEKIKNWRDANNNCEITLVLDSELLGGEQVKISEILEKPEEKLWSPVFVEHLDAEQRDNKLAGTKISSFERLANDLDTGKITITNNFSETLKYDYSEKIKYSCKKNNQSVTLTYQKVSWSVGGRQHTYHFWLPQGETGNRTLVFDFQERDYQESLKKIKKWQQDNNNCEITLQIDGESISIKDFSDDPHKFLGSKLFAKNLNPDERDSEKKGTKISRFDRLAKDLETGTMKVRDEFGEDLDFEYSQKLKDLCETNKKSITLSLSEVTWTDKVNSKNYKLTLWLPDSDEDKKKSVFTYLKRDYETATKKVQKWGEEVGGGCQIKLTISSSKNWFATMDDILGNSRGYVGAGLFTKELSRTVKNKDGEEVTERYSKMEKIAEELFSQELKITDEYGDELVYDYSKKIKEVCDKSQGKTVTLYYLESIWKDEVNKKTYSQSFWHPKDNNNNDNLIFNYLKRDYNTPIQKIKAWERENDCEIEIVLKQDEGLKVTVSKILENPAGYLEHGIFHRKVFIKDKDEIQDNYEKGVTTKYSQMEKLANDLTDKKVEILNSKKEEAHFYYSEGLKAACKGRKVTVYWRKVKLTEETSRIDRWYYYWTWEENKNTDSWFTNNVKTPIQAATAELASAAKLSKEQKEKAEKTTSNFETLI